MRAVEQTAKDCEQSGPVTATQALERFPGNRAMTKRPQMNITGGLYRCHHQTFSNNMYFQDYSEIQR